MLCMVVGARPNFVKMAPVIREADRRGVARLLVHTGQHYDAQMSRVFFDELEMPSPDVHLGVGSGSHAEQTARIMVAFEPLCRSHKPELVVVAGDVTSTLACALVAAKLNIPVAHIESGLRSFDRSMPEEINRILTDHLADLLFTTEPSGTEHLLRSGVASNKIHFVGNSMIDSLYAHLERALAREPWSRYGLAEGSYGVVTLHRPSNVDDPETARELIGALREVARALPLLFPMHPRTATRDHRLWEEIDNVRIVQPLGYLDFLGVVARARLVLTDSGGIQEETTALGVPCLTIRRNTERPATITHGTNRLVNPVAHEIVGAALSQPERSGPALVPHLWDGHASGRIMDIIEAWLAARRTRGGADSLEAPLGEC